MKDKDSNQWKEPFVYRKIAIILLMFFSKHVTDRIINITKVAD